MRLIDADALVKALELRSQYYRERGEIDVDFGIHIALDRITEACTIDLSVEQPYAQAAERLEIETGGKLRCDPATGNVGIGTPGFNKQDNLKERIVEALTKSASQTHDGNGFLNLDKAIDIVERELGESKQ